MTKSFLLPVILGVLLTGFLASDASATTLNFRVITYNPYPTEQPRIGLTLILGVGISVNNQGPAQSSWSWRTAVTDGSGIIQHTDPACLPLGTIAYYRVGIVHANGGIGWYSPWAGRGCDPKEVVNINLVTGNDPGWNWGLQNGGETCPNQSVGRPVNVTNGNTWLTHSDFVLSGRHELNISRTYNSISDRIGIFGYGWTTDLDESLKILSADAIEYHSRDGRTVFFVSFENLQDFRSASGQLYGRLTVVSGEYNLAFKDGRIHRFDQSGKLLWRKDRNGNQTTFTYNAAGRLIEITDPFGRSLTITPNADGRIGEISDDLGWIARYQYDEVSVELLKTVTYADGAKYQFDYVTRGTKTLLATVRDAQNNIVENHDYDIEGRATTSEIHGQEEKYEFDYSNWGLTTPYTLIKHKKAASDPVIETKYFFDKSRGVNVVTKTEGSCGCSGGGSEVTTFEYDSRANLTKRTNGLLQETTYSWDTNGNLLEQTDIYGTQKFTYNAYGEVLTYRDRVHSQSQNPVVYTQVNGYDSNGNLTSITDALGKVKTVNYPKTNNRGFPESIKDARQNVTKFGWGAPMSGLLEEIEDPYGKKTFLVYDARGRIRSVTNALQHTTTYNYHPEAPADRKVDVTYPNNDKVTYKYSDRQLLETVTDERGKITTYTFDPQYRLKRIIDPLGHAKEFGYDLMSNLITYTDPLSKVTDYKYDDLNRLWKIEHPAAEEGAARLTEEFKYDKLGRLQKYFDTATRLTEYEYDLPVSGEPNNRENTVKNADLEVTRVKYNRRFQAIEVKDELDQVYTFAYDPLGRLLSQTRAGAAMSYIYDDVGNRTKRTDFQGRQTKYTYDKLDRLTEIEYVSPPEIGSGPVPFLKSIYVYDEISRLTSATNNTGTVTFNYDNRNRIKNTTDVFGHLLEYEYERTTAVNQQRLKFDGAMHAIYDFDDAGRLDKLTNSSDSSVIDFVFDADDRLESRTYPNGVTTSYTYFDNDNLKRITDTGPSGTLFDRQYFYNSARQISQIIEPSRSRTFGYDNVDRLTSVTDATNGNENYAFDEVGNRTSSHRASNYGYTPDPPAPPAPHFNRVLSATTPTQTVKYGYDANGNMTTKGEGSNFWRYTWDHENRMAQAVTRKQTVRYKFDALGRRVQRFVPGGKENTKFIYDGQDVLADDNVGTLTKYQNGPGIDSKLRAQSGTAVNYFLGDHLGSTNGLTDSMGAITSQTTYDSFGNQTGSLATRFGFTGRERDDITGLMYYRARFYDPNLGRFISEDPIGFAGGDVNLYGYVGNSPIRMFDSLGLMPDGPTNYLRNPFEPRRWILNGLSNSLSDLLALDNVAKWSWAIGDYRCSTADQVFAAAKLGIHTGLSAAGGAVAGKAAGGLAGLSRNGSLVHLTNAEAAAAIDSSGVLAGAGGLPGNIYATQISNARSGVRAALTTGVTEYRAAVQIPSSASGAFSNVTPIGPFTTWQYLSGTQFTARGSLNLTTGAFERAGVNSNQVAGYIFDSIFTSVGLGVTRPSETGCGCR